MFSQLIGTAMGITIAFIGGYVIYMILKLSLGLRLTQEQELEGADLSIHKISSTPANEQ
jgi:Amt family ammonium transporter